MTYYLNIWLDSQNPKGAPCVQLWNTEVEAVEEIVDGPIFHYYDETIKVEGKTATVIDLTRHAEQFKHEQREEAQWA